MTGPTMFEKTYPLLSGGQKAGYWLSGLLLPWAMFLFIGSLDRSFEVRCERTAEGQTACEAREQSLLSTDPPVRFSLEGAHIEQVGRELFVVRPGERLRIATRATVLDGREAKAKLEQLARSNDASSAVVRGGFSPRPFVAMTPLSVLLFLAPMIALGGSVQVLVGGGQLRLRRARPLLGGAWQVFSLEGRERPVLSVHQLAGRYRSQGVLRVTVGGTTTTLVENASKAVLAQVAAEVNAHAALPPA